MQSHATPIIGFVGPSGSGKTTLLRQLVPLLKGQGLRLGYLKHAHHTFDLDRPGKDSFEVRAAGADQTLLASAQRWALQVENQAPGADPDLDEMLARFESDRLDLVLAEGFKYACYPKIEVHRAAVGQRPLYPDDPAIIAVVTDANLVGDTHPPALPLDDPPMIAAFLLNWLAAQGSAVR